MKIAQSEKNEKSELFNFKLLDIGEIKLRFLFFIFNFRFDLFLNMHTKMHNYENKFIKEHQVNSDEMQVSNSCEKNQK